MSLDAIGIVCESLQNSIEFYRLLGINLVETGGEEHYEGKTASGLRLMLDSAELMRKINPNWVKPTGVGIVLCFKQLDASGVNSLYSKVLELGYGSVKEPWDAFWGQRYCSVLDPDGNQIDIFADI